MALSPCGAGTDLASLHSMPFKREERTGRLKYVYDERLKPKDTHQQFRQATERRRVGGTGKRSYDPKVLAAMCSHYETWQQEKGSDLGLLNIRDEPHLFVAAFLQRVLLPKGGDWQTVSLQTIQGTWMKQWGNFIYYHLPVECCKLEEKDIEVWNEELRARPEVKDVLEEATQVG